MNDQEILEFISRNGGHPRAFYKFMNVLLRHLADYVWEWHVEGRYEDRVGPLFLEGGPPRYHFCCADPQDERASRGLLTQRQRSLIGYGHTYIQALRRRLWMITGDEGRRRPAHAWRRMYDIWRIFADGREMQLEIRGMAFALGYAHGVGMGRGVGTAASRERIPALAESAPAARAPVVRAPAAAAPEVARTTLQGIGPDIGHADTLPAIPARQPTRTLPGLGPGPSSPPTPTGRTQPGIGPELAPPRPPAARGGSAGAAQPREMRPIVEEAGGANGRPSEPAQAARPIVRNLLPPGATVEPIIEQFRGLLNHNFQPTPSGREFYALEWQSFGGHGPPPEHGFIVRNADGTVHRAVGFGWLPGTQWPRRPSPAQAPAPRPGGGLARPQGGSVESLTDEERAVLFFDRSETRFNNYLPTPSGTESYAFEWQFFGGQGPPPAHGFIVRNANHTRYCTVGFGPVPTRR